MTEHDTQDAAELDSREAMADFMEREGEPDGGAEELWSLLEPALPPLDWDEIERRRDAFSAKSTGRSRPSRRT